MTPYDCVAMKSLKEESNKSTTLWLMPPLPVASTAEMRARYAAESNSLCASCLPLGMLLDKELGQLKKDEQISWLRAA